MNLTKERIQYNRGFNQGLCYMCEVKNYIRKKEDKTSDEVIGKIEACETCPKKKYLRVIENDN